MGETGFAESIAAERKKIRIKKEVNKNMAAKEEGPVQQTLERIPNMLMQGSQIEPSLEQEREKYREVTIDGARGRVEPFRDINELEGKILLIDCFSDGLRQVFTWQLTRQDALALRNRIDDIFKGNDLPGYI